MDNEVEIHCGSTEIPTNVEPKEGDTMNNEVETHGGSTVEIPKHDEPEKGWIKTILKLAWSWLLLIDKNTWLEQIRGNLGLMATVIATMTFQMALNPPGGVRSVRDYDLKHTNLEILYQTCGILSDKYIDLCPGEAILAAVYPDEYYAFLVSNTICFVASLSVCLLLVSGIPMKHRFPIWLLVIGMCGTITSLTISYITALTMITPDYIFDKSYNFLRKLVHTWYGLLASIALWHTLMLVICGMQIYRERSKLAKTQLQITNGIPVC